MTKNKYKELEHDSRFGKKSYQERLLQDKEAQEEINLYGLQQQEELPDNLGDAFKNEQ